MFDLNGKYISETGVRDDWTLIDDLYEARETGQRI